MVSVTKGLGPDVAEEQVYGVLSRPPFEHYLSIAIRMANSEAEPSEVITNEFESSQEVPLENCAICFDTNAVLNLARRGESDLLDYLSGIHNSPLILPAQGFNEFWNNLDSITIRFGQKIQKQISDLNATLASVPSLAAGDSIHGTLNILNSYKWDDANSGLGSIAAKLVRLLSIFRDRSCVISAVDRARFGPLGEYRLLAKAPPGFMDGQLLGDFFIWADCLKALLVATGDFSAVVLVTDDNKKDWKAGSQAHPSLQADVRKLLDCAFRVMTSNDLINYTNQLGATIPSQQVVTIAEDSE